ncbi:BRO-N domain-containing protein [Clostridium formicaceticum]|uniref:Bro-N domain-containing protein n=1 Tax=Clostridium formicaceticum TaxID=1497 RepID=A0AAC9RJ96_9CLOT|nr:hypothetical protein CLFO_14720 [Clostridium formicaceticum]
MKGLKIFNSQEFGQVRTLIIQNEPWFVGKDVAEALGYAEPRSVISKKVDEEDKGVARMETPSGMQEMTIINESGLYSLILSSKLESAKKFKRWVTSEVLPSIRKTGSYLLNYKPKATSVGEVASLIKILKVSMKDQGSAAHEITSMEKMICEQFNIDLPENFVKKPAYMQLTLTLPIE